MDYEKINEEFYSKSYWGIDRSERKWFSKYVKIKILKKMMKNVNKGVLYDAGGGVGNHGWFFGRDFDKTIVSDISEQALIKIPEKWIKKLKCSVVKNNLPDNSVDCILLIDVFEHIHKKDLLKMMKDLNRVLKPDGRLLIFTSHYGWGAGAIIQRIFNSKKRLLGEEYLEGHVNRLKFNEFKKLFKTAKFSIESYYFYSVIFQQLTDFIKDNFARIFSKIKKEEEANLTFGRTGQNIKERIREKEDNFFFRLPLYILSYVSYLDIILFSKIPLGNSVFFSLKKQNPP